MRHFVSLHALTLTGVGSPAALLLLLGATSLVRRPMPERWMGRLVAAAMTASCAAFCAAFLVHVTTRHETVVLYGAWSSSHAGGIAVEFLLDRTSLAFAAIVAGITGIVGAFSHRYLHREPGYHRYFFLLAMFVTGMLLVALAGNVEVLFAGWEFVGLSSALLVGYFHDRPAPVSNALRVFAVYRISDAAMLSAVVLLHHVAGSGSLSLLLGSAHGLPPALSGGPATLIALLLLAAVAGKSALLPFSGWLPRAMEGPTPSSAVYYGALSIHAGCFLLLRAEPLLHQSLTARAIAGALGAATALFATTTGRVQSDVKSSLAYASLTQVGLIVVEIAAGLQTLAFLHLVGHACFRLFQFLSAPNVLHDLHSLEAATGERLAAAPGPLHALLPDALRRRLFLFALERGFLDATLDAIVVGPFQRAARGLSRLDVRLCDLAARHAPSLRTPEGDAHDD